MPGRQVPDLPTGRLSIEEKIEAVNSLTISIKNDNSLVSQFNIGTDENGNFTVLMMNVNVPWNNPIKGVEVSYDHVCTDDAKTEIHPYPPLMPWSNADTTAEDSLVNMEEDVAKEATDNIKRKSMSNDSFEAARNALPRINTPRGVSEADDESLYSHEELRSLQAFLKASSVGKKYFLKMKKDGGLLADMKGVVSMVKMTKRNVYVVKKDDAHGDPGFTMILSKTRPKHCVNIRDLPIGVDIWMAKKAPNQKSTPVTDIEYTMLQHIREAIVSYFTF
uniref:Uncharacterized protein n=1 Tax=viral metagenome TaxID=1070528 RepID=A0A2V0RAI5_9ZZZZ